MSWASKTNDQWQTVGDVTGALGGALRAYGSAPAGKTSSQWINYTEFKAWVQTNGSLTGSSRWVTKNAVNSYVLNLPYSFTLYVPTYHGIVVGYASSSDACTHASSTTISVYTTSSSITTGTVLYKFDYGTNSFVPFVFPVANEWAYDIAGNQAIQLGTAYTNTVAGTSGCGGSAPTYNYYVANKYTCAGTYSGTQNVCCLDAASGGANLSINTGYYFASTDLTYVFYITATTTINTCPIIFTTAYSTPNNACLARDGA